MASFEDKVNGRRVVVTGASTGLGRVLALAFARAGARLAVCARSEDRLRSLAEEVESQGGTVLHSSVDVTRPDQLSAFAEEIESKLGGVDTVVANAGVTDQKHHSLLELPFDAWNRVITINVTGTFNTFQTFLPLLKQSSGNAVVMSSLLGQRGYGKANDAPYCTSKFAIEGLVEVAAEELKTAPVNVNTIYPAEKVDTEFFSHLSPEERRKLARPEVIIGPVFFLATLHSGALTKVSLDAKRWREEQEYREELVARAGVEQGDNNGESTDS